MKRLLIKVLFSVLLISSGANADLVFTLEEASGQANAEATVTIAEVPGEPWAVDITIEVPTEPAFFVADISAFYFNFPVEEALGGVVIAGSDVTHSDTKIAPETDFTGFIAANSLSGVAGFPDLFNVGVQFGGAGDDQIHSTTFRFSINDAFQDLIPGGFLPTIFQGSAFALRVRSLGEDGEDSSKLICLGDCFPTEIPAPAPLLLVLAGLVAIRSRRKRLTS